MTLENKITPCKMSQVKKKKELDNGYKRDIKSYQRMAQNTGTMNSNIRNKCRQGKR